MIKTKVTWNGNRNMRLIGAGFGKFQMAKLGQVLLRSVRRRVARGIGAEDTPMPPLKENYRRKKRHSKIRDLWLTGKMMLNLTLRSASERIVKIALTSRKARQKALANQRLARWLAISPNDKKVTMTEAKRLFKTKVTEIQQSIRGGGRRRGGRSQFQRNPAQFRREA